MINLDNPRYIVWGFKNRQNYHTHGHIHSGFERTLRLTGKDVRWLDHSDDISKEDFSDCLFITEHEAAKKGMPVRDDSFYVCHGLRNDPEASALLKDVKTLSWNVYHDYSRGGPEQWDGKPIHTLEEYNKFMANVPLDSTRSYGRIFLAEDTPYYPLDHSIDFRWATDLIPSEIQALKPLTFPGPTKKIYWIGTKWFVNDKELEAFNRACEDNGIEFVVKGAGRRSEVVSIEDNIKLVRESYFAPAISGSHHLTEGYLPCRVLKNISYGAMGVTNSKRVNDVFGGRLIYNPDPYELFAQAVHELPKISEARIRGLMDYVAENHTYLNRIASIREAIRLVLEDR